MYRSSEFISEFYDRVKLTLRRVGIADYEIIFVNDGSPDSSLVSARKLIELDRKVKVVDLSKNFGHHKAMMAGLAQVNKELTFLIDIDLEEPPELLSELMKEMNDTEADLVYGVQRKRKGKFFERFSGFVYYTFVKLLAEYSIQRNHSTIRLMTDEYRKSLLLYAEKETPISVIWEDVGYKQTPLIFDKGVRPRSKSTYSFGRKVSLSIKMLASLGTKPLLIVYWMGTSMVLLSVVVGLFVSYQAVVNDQIFEGWVSIILSIWFLGGLNSAYLGIVGIYISNIVREVKNRPLYIIKKVYEFHDQ